MVADSLPPIVDPGVSLGESLVGRHIGNYRILRELGRGGMGVVYLGEHPAIGTKVAVKVLAGHLSGRPAMARRFMAEARAANLTNHPGIIRVFDFGRLEDGRLYMVMEFLAGVELAEYLKKHAPLPSDEAVALVEEIASALDAAHGVGIVHRDLKPSNVFLADQGGRRMVKLLDFGIAKLFGEIGAGVHQTSTGVVIGTPLYMAPEQAAGRQSEISARTDIYALGVMTYEMLAGTPPFVAPNAAELLWAHLHETPKPLSEVAPQVPESLSRAVMQALTKAPEERPKSAGAFARMLREGLDASGAQAASRESGVAADFALSATIAQPGAQADRDGEGRNDVEQGRPADRSTEAVHTGSRARRLLAIVLAGFLAAGFLAWMVLGHLGPHRGVPRRHGAPQVRTGGQASVSQPTPSMRRAPRVRRSAPFHTLHIGTPVTGARIVVSVDGREQAEAALPLSLRVKEGGQVVLRARCPDGSQEERRLSVRADLDLEFCIHARMRPARPRAKTLARRRLPTRKPSRRSKPLRGPRRQRESVRVGDGVMDLPE